jgi:hypothetical protein
MIRMMASFWRSTMGGRASRSAGVSGSSRRRMSTIAAVTASALGEAGSTTPNMASASSPRRMASPGRPWLVWMGILMA